MATTDQDFVYTATGSEGSDFFVSLPAARPNVGYRVSVAYDGIANILGIDMPNISGGDRTTTQFRVVTSSSPQAGDRFAFHVYIPVSYPDDGGTLFVAASSATPRSTGPTWDGTKWVVGTSIGALTYPISFYAQGGVNKKIISWLFSFRKTSATGTITATLGYLNLDTGLPTTIGSSQTNSANNPGYANFYVFGLTETITNGRSYFLNVTGGGTTGDEFYGVEVGMADSG
jgi:hypothetical protein